MKFTLWFIIILMCFSVNLYALEGDWFEGDPGSTNGASRDYYNNHALLKWKNYMGDWSDKNDTAQGSVAFSEATVVDDDLEKMIEWDVTSLVSKWTSNEFQNKGFFLRITQGGGSYRFHSKEAADNTKKPILVISTASETKYLLPIADTYITPSSYKSFGDAVSLSLSTNKPVLIRFDLQGITAINSAKLQLVTHSQSGGTGSVGIYRSSQGHEMPNRAPTFGIAAQYTKDAGLGSHPDILFFEDFENSNWTQNWSYVGGDYQVVSEDSNLLLDPILGKALSVNLPQGGNNGINATYKFQEKQGSEPEEVFFRYYARLANDWNQIVDGGKLPGLSGTYGVAGWGGRKSNGTNGWSTRGAYIKTASDNNPLSGKTGIGNYIYHADMTGNYGDIAIWQNDYLGYLEKNRWYSIEQQVKMNTPGMNDGILRTWVDGIIAYEITSLRFRDTSSLKIEQLWLNIYHGGTAKSPYDQHMFVDNIVLAKSYIGPAAGLEQGVIVPSRPTNLKILVTTQHNF